MRSTSATDRAEAPRPLLVLGRHRILDLRGCPAERIGTVAAVEGPFLRALAAAGARVLGHRSHQFSPAGATVVALLAESHASLHTWPEHGYAGLDIFTCGESLDPGPALAALARELGATDARTRIVDRGVPR